MPLSTESDLARVAQHDCFLTLGRVRVSESEEVLFLYGLVVATAITGLLHWPVWAAVVGGTAIGLVNIAEETKLRARFASIGANDVLTTAHLASLATGWLAGLAAWALGRFSVWAFWP